MKAVSLIGIVLFLFGFQAHAAGFDKPVTVVGYNGYSIVSIYNNHEARYLIALRCEEDTTGKLIRICEDRQIGFDEQCSINDKTTISLSNVARFNVGNSVPAQIFEAVQFTCD